ncbi:hypothetical protein D3C81_1828280 [compost metagenome]
MPKPTAVQHGVLPPRTPLTDEARFRHTLSLLHTALQPMPSSPLQDYAQPVDAPHAPAESTRPDSSDRSPLRSDHLPIPEDGVVAVDLSFGADARYVPSRNHKPFGERTHARTSRIYPVRPHAPLHPRDR